MNTMEFLESRFPGAVLIRPSDVGALLSQSRQSSYNQVSSGRFPVPLVVDHLNRKMVRLSDLAAYLDGMQTIQPLPAEPRKQPKTLGRPTKTEQVEAGRRGLTVQELRAQSRIGGL